MNITQLQQELRTVEEHEAAQALTVLAQESNGVEMHLALDTIANKLAVPIEIAQAGLRLAVKAGTLKYSPATDSEKTLLTVK